MNNINLIKRFLYKVYYALNSNSLISNCMILMIQFGLLTNSHIIAKPSFATHSKLNIAIYINYKEEFFFVRMSVAVSMILPLMAIASHLFLISQFLILVLLVSFLIHCFFFYFCKLCLLVFLFRCHTYKKSYVYYHLMNRLQVLS